MLGEKSLAQGIGMPWSDRRLALWLEAFVLRLTAEGMVPPHPSI